MRRALFGVLLGVSVGVACGDPFTERAFDCAAIVDAYMTSCGSHLAISIETAACEAVRVGQNGALAVPIDRAAAVCESITIDPATAPDCDAIFVCLDDEQGFGAVTRSVQVTGTATVEGEPFTLTSTTGHAWVGTTMGGNPGDFEVLFAVDGKPWYFRLDDFAARARTRPFVVDEARRIKLENSEDNLELTIGEVEVAAFAIDGAFDVAATGTDPATGESLEVRFVGSFAAAQ